MRKLLTKIKRDTTGFTMIELLVSFTLFAVLVVVVAPMFKQGSDIWQVSQSEVELRQNLNSALEYMAKEIRLADPNSIKTNSGEIFSYKIGSDHYSFTLTNGQIQHHKPTGTEAITPTSIKITQAPQPNNPGGSWTLQITGKYNRASGLPASASKTLTVQKQVFPRKALSGVEEWTELN